MEPLVLAIDQGTTNTKAVLFNAAGQPAASGSAAVPISHPRPGWVEQDARRIWASVEQAVAECVAEVEPERITAIGIANQRESILAWDAADDEPVGPCVTWQCRRGEAICAKLAAQGVAEQVRAATGLPLDPMFSAGKAHWLIANSQCPVDRLRLGTVDSWLVWRITGGRHIGEESNASRTLLFDIHSGRWDDALCELFEIPRQALPEVMPSDGEFGATRGFAGLPDGIPVRAVLGDSHAALFGHGALVPGQVKATYGTGSSLMNLLDRPLIDDSGIACTIAWHVGGTRHYALEGNILVSASVLPWLAGLIGAEGGADELAAMAAQAQDTAGVFLVPALVGLGAPHWCGQARGLVSGLTFNAGRAELARAAFESIAFQVDDVLAAMAAGAGARPGRLFADGGPSANEWLMQFQADLLGVPVVTGDVREASALGVAGVAGIATGLWPDADAYVALDRGHQVFEPAMAAAAREQLRAGWRHAIAQATLPGQATG